MSDTAVTQPVSAPAQEVESTLPDSEREVREYIEQQNKRDVAQRKGEQPKAEGSAPSTEVEQQGEASAESEDPASSEAHSETAAASEAAPHQEPRGKKTSQTSESRWAKITRENRELKERLARIEAAQTQTALTRDTQQTSQPAPQTQTEVSKGTPKPKIDDVDPKTGQPKFKTYEDYLDARDSWLRAETQREIEESQAKRQREIQQRQQQELIAREWGSRVQKAQEKYSDYEAVALNPDLTIKQGSPVDMFILDSPHGVDVLYHLGKNPAELARINALNPLAQVRELTRIEIKLSSPPVRRITQAPAPVRTVAAQGTVSGDELESALKEDDFSGYRDRANARDMASRRGR
jgi:hypothetical protein